MLSGLDRLAAQASLSQLTSRRLSEMAGVAEGVMFRLFNGMDGILEQWIESRGGRLLTLISGAPANRAGFLRMLRSLLEVPELLGLLFDELKGITGDPGPARWHCVSGWNEQLSRQLQCLTAPGGGGSLLFADHLWVSPQAQLGSTHAGPRRASGAFTEFPARGR